MNPARGTAAVAVVLATAGTLLGSTAVTASAATTCASPVFKRELFANTTFKGTPKKTDCDSAISESWSGAPASGLPKDNFGVRWTVTRDFGSGGPFALAASGLDGIRVYLDGTRRIDLWKNTTKTVAKTVNVTVPKGRHTLRVDYANWTGAAKAKFTYTPSTSAAVDKVKPLTPLDPLVSYDSGSNTTKLSWTKNQELDLAGYRVYRRLRGSTGWTRLTTTTATSYTDTPPATGAVYYYEVRAYDKAGNESAGTADQSVTSITLAAPTGLGWSVTDTTATVTWRAVPGAPSFRVERCTAYSPRRPGGPQSHGMIALSGNVVVGPTAGRAGSQAGGGLVRPVLTDRHGPVKQEPTVVPRSGTDRNLQSSGWRGRQWVDAIDNAGNSTTTG
nr:PA14 domain-containing protein [Streptomyces hyaluromycini]